MTGPSDIILPSGLSIPILFEDRSVLAIDKPAGWMLAPDSWENTRRNLKLALIQSIRAGDHWARSRHLRFIRYLHRLDAETTGVLLLAKSPGVVRPFSELFSRRRVLKVYLAVVAGEPKRVEWDCSTALAPDLRSPGRMRAGGTGALPAETHFRVLAARPGMALLEVRPLTGRTHQIRVHLAHSGHPVLGDSLYAPPRQGVQGSNNLGLRAVALAYDDPFRHRPVRIVAPAAEFLRRFGFGDVEWTFLQPARCVTVQKDRRE